MLSILAAVIDNEQPYGHFLFQKCFPTLLELPITFALFHFVKSSNIFPMLSHPENRQQPYNLLELSIGFMDKILAAGNEGETSKFTC